MTLRAEEFSPEFVDWVNRAGNELHDEGDHRVAMNPPGGEFILFLERLENDWVRVSRKDRSDPEQWEFDASSVDVVEHCFTGDLGWDVRSRAGLPLDLRIPVRLDELAPGASLDRISTDKGDVEQVSLRGHVLAEFPAPARNFHRAVELSHYCSASLAEIRESFLSSDGKPLFRLREGAG